jgi:hypothetical protein
LWFISLTVTHTVGGYDLNFHFLCEAAIYAYSLLSFVTLSYASNKVSNELTILINSSFFYTHSYYQSNDAIKVKHISDNNRILVCISLYSLPKL